MATTETLLVVGDRVLVRPEDPAERTKSGLYLPAGVQEGDRVRGGRVVKTGPGLVIPNPEFSDAEPWAPQRDAVRYLPLQAREGDYALFLRKEAVELEWQGEAYLIVPHSAILALARAVHPEDLPNPLPGGLN
jgi:chaperonin GroES